MSSARTRNFGRAITERDLTHDRVCGEVLELQPFNAVLSKRSAQIRRNLDRIEGEW